MEADVFVRRGAACRQGRFDLALESLERSLELDSTNWEAMIQVSAHAHSCGEHLFRWARMG
jgi:Flp pilus assembly protein TadD